MLDAVIELIPMLRNSLLNDREKRLVALVIVLSLPLTIFLVSFIVAYAIIINRQTDTQGDANEITSKPVLRSVIKYDAIEKDALYALLTKIYDDNNFFYAEKIADKIILSDSTDNLAQYFMAKIKIENEKYAEANVILQSLKVKNYMPDSLKTLSISLVKLYELEDIIGDTLSLSATQLAKIGERFILAKNNNLAHIFLTKALQKDGGNTEALYQYAIWNMNNKNYAAAEKQLKKLLSIDSTSSKFQGRYAILLHETGRSKLALEHYRKSMEKNFYDFNVIYNLGELYHSSLNDRENAKKCFLRVVELSPNSWQGYFKLGLISNEEGNFDAAINYFLKADGFSPDNIRILRLLASAYERNNDNDNALKIYNRILKIDPLDEIALYKERLLKQ